MIKFKTESGSVYEVDSSACRARRLSGKRPPTPNQGPDGEWKTYGLISPVRIGKAVLFVWEIADDDVMDWRVRQTLTGDVIEVTSW